MNHPNPEVRRSMLLTADHRPVALHGVSITGEVLGAHARLCIRQRYKNEEKQPIEAIYTFPLPSDAVLVGFAMECAGRRLTGGVKEREEAFREYDEAIAAGHGGALLDQERKNVFTASVGNLLPDEETILEVVYVQRLGADEGALRLMIPTLVAPRYIPGEPSGDRTGHGVVDPTTRVPDADRISPAIGNVAYGLSLDVVFDVGAAVSIESPSHAVASRAEGARVHVEMAQKDVALDRDIVLLAAHTESRSAGLVAHREDGEGTFALTVVPDLFRGQRPGPRDVVFVVDVSGSMQGASIEQARSALRLCLRHLTEGDRFNVIAFSMRHHGFQPRLVPFTQRTLEESDAWVAQLQAEGGTEILKPLLAALETLSDTKRDRTVILLTDGQVGNESEIVARVTEKLERVRIYTFGIGTNVSDLLLNELARKSTGAAEFIHPGERIDEKVTAQFARAVAPRVEGVSMKLLRVEAGELSPAELPPLIDGEPWVVYGRYEQPGIGRAEIRGTLAGEPFVLEVPIELPSRENRPALPALWAQSRIRDLEDGESRISGRRAGAQKERIVKLSIAHGVGSKYTSFVVIEKRSGDRRSHGMPEARPVPVHAPAGWAAFDAPKDFVGVRHAMAMSAPGLYGAGAPAAPAALAPAARGFASRPRVPAAAPFAPVPRPVVAARPEPQAIELSALIPPPDRIREIAERQLASGLWAGDADTDEALLVATARALLECFTEGIDTGHPRFGVPLKKAISAIHHAANELSKLARGEYAIAAAFAAAFLVASGSRLREQIRSAVRGNAMTAAFADQLTDNGTARKMLDEALSRA